MDWYQRWQGESRAMDVDDDVVYLDEAKMEWYVDE